MTASGDRSRSVKDNTATFSMSNMLPQLGSNNSGSWRSLEGWAQDVAKFLGMELYVVAGGEKKRASITGASTGLEIDVPSQLWKAILFLDTPITNVSEIPSSAMSFAFRIDNSTTQSPWFGNNQIYNIDQLEEELGSDYDFWSNLLEDVEQIIEGRSLADIQDWIQVVDNQRKAAKRLSANLLTSSQSRLLLGTSDVETSVRQTNTLEHTSKTFHALNEYSFSSPQISISQVGTIETSFLQESSSQVSSHEVRVADFCLFECNATKDRIGKVSPIQVTLVENGSSKIGLDEPHILKVTPNHNHSTHPSFSQIDSAPVSIQGTPAEIDPDQTSPTQSSGILFRVQFDPSEVSFPSSIPFYKFFSSHDSNSQDTATLEWAGLTKLSELTFEVKNLPIGQLAEAQLTRFDTNGSPTAGTILIDDDANGLGWFIDPTPWESSEFSTQNTAYNLQATEDSAAYGRYESAKNRGKARKLVRSLPKCAALSL